MSDQFSVEEASEVITGKASATLGKNPYFSDSASTTPQSAGSSPQPDTGTTAVQDSEGEPAVEQTPGNGTDSASFLSEEDTAGLDESGVERLKEIERKMQASFTKKMQKLSEERRSLESEMQERLARLEGRMQERQEVTATGQSEEGLKFTAAFEGAPKILPEEFEEYADAFDRWLADRADRIIEYANRQNEAEQAQQAQAQMAQSYKQFFDSISEDEIAQHRDVMLQVKDQLGGNLPQDPKVFWSVVKSVTGGASATQEQDIEAIRKAAREEGAREALKRYQNSPQSGISRPTLNGASSPPPRRYSNIGDGIAAAMREHGLDPAA